MYESGDSVHDWKFDALQVAESWVCARQDYLSEIQDAALTKKRWPQTGFLSDVSEVCVAYVQSGDTRHIVPQEPLFYILAVQSKGLCT